MASLALYCCIHRSHHNSAVRTFPPYFCTCSSLLNQPHLNPSTCNHLHQQQSPPQTIPICNSPHLQPAPPAIRYSIYRSTCPLSDYSVCHAWLSRAFLPADLLPSQPVPYHRKSNLPWFSPPLCSIKTVAEFEIVQRSDLCPDRVRSLSEWPTLQMKDRNISESLHLKLGIWWMIIPRPAVDKQAGMTQLVWRGTVTCDLRFRQAKSNTEITTINPPNPSLRTAQHRDTVDAINN